VRITMAQSASGFLTRWFCQTIRRPVAGAYALGRRNSGKVDNTCFVL
jgi:hypothetical protein